MKKKIKITLLLSFFVLLLSSCEINGPTIDLSSVPLSLRKTLYINYEAGLGTVTFSTTKIDVVRGGTSDFGDSSTNTMYLGFYNDAAEFDTDRLTNLGYSITAAGSTSAQLILTCTKAGASTIKYIFNISNPDIWVEKKVDNVTDSSYATVLTWDPF